MYMEVSNRIQGNHYDKPEQINVKIFCLKNKIFKGIVFKT